MKKFRVTVEIPDRLYRKLDKAVEEGYACSKSELIRKAIEIFLENEVVENE